MRPSAESSTAAGGYVFRVPLDPIDPDWTLRLGDCVYNTRASLDYLITASIRSAGNEEHETSQFPIVGIDRRAWREIDEWWEKDPSGTITRHLQATPAGTKAALKTLQPFYGVPRVDPWRHPLFALQTLSNRDKHRRLNVVVRGVLIRFEDAAGQPIFHGPPPHARISEDHDRDTYTVALAVREPLGQEVPLVPAYDVRLQEPPHLFGALIATLSSVTSSSTRTYSQR